jgi:3-ketoacyl-CoA synthase
MSDLRHRRPCVVSNAAAHAAPMATSSSSSSKSGTKSSIKPDTVSTNRPREKDQDKLDRFIQEALVMGAHHSRHDHDGDIGSFILSTLEHLPSGTFTPSSWEAAKRLVLTTTLSVLACHALLLSPDWGVPICWIFVAVSMAFLFEILHDCSTNTFFSSPTMNRFVAYLSMFPLLQPAMLQTSQTHVVTNSWSAWLWSWRQIATRGLRWSSIPSIVVITVVVPLVAYMHGVWPVLKFWMIPFVLYHMITNMYIVRGANLKILLQSCTTYSWHVDMAVRSYLRFTLHVPSYRLGSAMDRIRRMWNRASLEKATPMRMTNDADTKEADSDSKLPQLDKDALLDTVSLTSYARGLAHFRFFETTMSISLTLLSMFWLFLLQRAYGRELQDAALRTSAYTRPLTAELKSLFYTSPHAALHLGLVGGAIIILYAIVRYTSRKPVYLVDFVTYTTPSELYVPTEDFKKLQRKFPFTEESLKFMDRLIHRTGLGETTAFPPGTLADPPDLTFRQARIEAETVMFTILDQLFASTDIGPRDIDILVVNCSLFCPTPSLASMIVNKYKMRQDIQSYNLGGMGCSAGVISIHLAKDLLSARPNSRALVVSTENITMNWYRGNERGMLISNTLFRMGGAAVMLSNRSGDETISRYELLHTVRTHRGADDKSYGSVFQDTDKDGCLGVRLSKELMNVAGEALKRNITTLGPLILPWSEQIKYFWNAVCRKVFKMKRKPYVPRFKKAIDHFAVHAGGRAVLEAITTALSLEPEDLAASKATLYKHGNTSSSSIWYELSFLEKSGSITAGHKIWQIAFGSGFKCNSCVLEAL